MKILPLSKVISLRILKSFIIYNIKSSANLEAIISLVIYIYYTSFVYLLTTTRIELYTLPLNFEGRSPVIKSKVISYYS